MEKNTSSISDSQHSLIRAFVAVPIPEAASKELDRYLNSLKNMTDLRWVTAAQFHITLRFLGEQTQEIIEHVRDALSHVRFSPFEIELSYTGAFPNMRCPRVLWLSGNQGKRELIALAETVNKSMDAIGLPHEKRAFKPHLTLARTNGVSLPSELLRELKNPPKLHWCSDNFDLMRSKLTPQGPLYSKIPLSKEYDAGKVYQ
ncbi:MAG: RNA 2',3'-cyclic phosphodiesterase [Spirochaetales bacterium]|nr:RNA 2',3'-cyclic phosphodiesterase [Spirochaetales bacterium]